MWDFELFGCNMHANIGTADRMLSCSSVIYSLLSCLLVSKAHINVIDIFSASFILIKLTSSHDPKYTPLVAADIVTSHNLYKTHPSSTRYMYIYRRVWHWSLRTIRDIRRAPCASKRCWSRNKYLRICSRFVYLS